MNTVEEQLFEEKAWFLLSQARMLKISEDANSFPIGAIASYYKYVTQNKLLILRFWRSGVRKGSHWAKNKIIVGCIPFLSSGRESVFLFFWSLEVARIPCFMTLSCAPIASSGTSFFWVPLVLLNSLWFVPAGLIQISPRRANPDYSPHQDLQWSHFCKILLTT